MRAESGPVVEPIRAVATSFRVALELGGLRLGRLAAFPRGSCGDACELLGQYLIDSGFGASAPGSGIAPFSHMPGWSGTV